MKGATRIIVETACEHGWRRECGEFVCDHPLPHRPTQFEIKLECWCPGASRKVLSPDYHGAATVMGEVRDDPDAYAAAVRVVDTALHRMTP